ncbi:MAG: hypothetical protein LBN04_07835 [Oscillospiraceae bacterium]|jgi:hypothetical protein|nr:hypothetical protein [Oscillospiraceae bacterium]
MGHLGFSYVGLFFLILLIAPNLLWAKRQPQGYTADGESPALRLFERAGQAMVCACALLFSDFNLRPWSLWSVWLVAALLLMALYEWWWVRYFRSPRRLEDFYRPMLGIPVAGATLPVLAFFLLGIYGRVIWMLLAATILGIGHIGIHWQHARQA